MNGQRLLLGVAVDSLVHRRITRLLPSRERGENVRGRRVAYSSSAGFTLVELLVCLAVISVLFAISLSAIQAARESARRTECHHHLRQVAQAVQEYHTAHHRLPYGRFTARSVGGMSRNWSFYARLLPHLGEDTLNRLANVERTTLLESGIADRQLSVLRCPSDGYSHRGPRYDGGDCRAFPLGQTNYQGVSGANWGADETEGSDDIGTAWRHLGTNGSYDGLNHGDGSLYRNDGIAVRRFSLFTDGISKTFLLGESLPERNIWCSWPYSTHAYATCAIPPNAQPIGDESYDPSWWPNVAGFRSNHPGGVSFALADASVHLVADSIDLTLYRALATIAGGETVQAD